MGAFFFHNQLPPLSHCPITGRYLTREHKWFGTPRKGKKKKKPRQAVSCHLHIEFTVQNHGDQRTAGTSLAWPPHTITHAQRPSHPTHKIKVHR